MFIVLKKNKILINIYFYEKKNKKKNNFNII